ncbi:cyclic nucleotide-binding domain-containing protein, partial [uncultured Clostridium sp.]
MKRNNLKLDKISLFSQVSKNTIYKLNEFCFLRELKKGEHLFRDKEIINSIYIVKSGKIALYKQSESAQKKVVFILGKDTVINEV